jgi:hypothetical protein
MKRSIWKAWGIVSLSSALGCTGIGGGEPSAYEEARSRVVYGQDDRRDPYAYPVGSQPYTWARSSAMLVGTSSLQREEGTGFVLAATETLCEAMKASGKPLCPEEPFQDQLTFVGVCSAFLVAPDAVITAGHCMTPADLCPRMAFVFGVGYGRKTRDPSRLGADDVYFCKDVLERVWDHVGADYAVVKVDRPVVGRAPLPLRRAGKVADDEELVLIGNPLGLPTKIAAGGKVLDNAPEHFFKASTDSYGGGSGSAVIGAHSGLVEGVLMRGEEDFMQSGDCWVSKVCPEGGSPCCGEDVSRATELAAALDRHGCEQDRAAFGGALGGALGCPHRGGLGRSSDVQTPLAGRAARGQGR